jgi:hypothetical protein
MSRNEQQFKNGKKRDSPTKSKDPSDEKATKRVKLLEEFQLQPQSLPVGLDRVLGIAPVPSVGSVSSSSTVPSGGSESKGSESLKLSIYPFSVKVEEKNIFPKMMATLGPDDAQVLLKRHPPFETISELGLVGGPLLCQLGPAQLLAKLDGATPKDGLADAVCELWRVLHPSVTLGEYRDLACSKYTHRCQADWALFPLAWQLTNVDDALTHFSYENLKQIVLAKREELAVFMDSRETATEWQDMCRDQIDVLQLKFENEELSRQLNRDDKQKDELAKPDDHEEDDDEESEEHDDLFDRIQELQAEVGQQKQEIVQLRKEKDDARFKCVLVTRKTHCRSLFDERTRRCVQVIIFFLFSSVCLCFVAVHSNIYQAILEALPEHNASLQLIFSTKKCLEIRDDKDHQKLKDSIGAPLTLRECKEDDLEKTWTKLSCFEVLTVVQIEISSAQITKVPCYYVCTFMCASLLVLCVLFRLVETYVCALHMQVTICQRSSASDSCQQLLPPFPVDDIGMENLLLYLSSVGTRHREQPLFIVGFHHGVFPLRYLFPLQPAFIFNNWLDAGKYVDTEGRFSVW